jgi:hypothetical protein
LADIKRQSRLIEALYIFGDLVGPTQQFEELVERVRKPFRGELEPLVCKGWWEEQCLILHGLGADGEPTELIEKYGGETVKLLWESLSRLAIVKSRLSLPSFLETFPLGFMKPIMLSTR